MLNILLEYGKIETELNRYVRKNENSELVPVSFFYLCLIDCWHLCLNLRNRWVSSFLCLYRQVT